MKKMILNAKIICLLAMVLVSSCSKDNPVEQKEKKTEIEKGALNVEVKQLFLDVQKDVMNIMIKDTLYYQVEISAPQKTNQKIGFNLDFESREYKYHQYLGQDYHAFFLKIEKTPLRREELNFDKIPSLTNNQSFTELGKYLLIIIPLKAGTYQHSYNFFKMVDGKYTKESAITKRINFNCVELISFFRIVKVKGVGIAQKFRNDYFFRIDDGENETDDNLISKEGRVQTYLVEYDG